MIEVKNFTACALAKDVLIKVAKKVLKGENRKNETLSIVLVGPRRMRVFNSVYRRMDRVTDVLSFQAAEQTKESFSVPAEAKKEIGLGELVICPAQVAKNATLHQVSVSEELALVLVHGILHLLGYDHEKSEAQAKKMEVKQQHYLSITKTFWYK